MYIIVLLLLRHSMQLSVDGALWSTKSHRPPTKNHCMNHYSVALLLGTDFNSEKLTVSLQEPSYKSSGWPRKPSGYKLEPTCECVDLIVNTALFTTQTLTSLTTGCTQYAASRPMSSRTLIGSYVGPTISTVVLNYIWHHINLNKWWYLGMIWYKTQKWFKTDH